MKKVVATSDWRTTLHLALEDVCVKTSSGTIIKGMTMQAIEHELDAYLFAQRTGVQVMENASRLPIKKIAERAGCDVTDKRKVMSQFEKEYDEWVKTRPISGGLGTTVLDPDFAKTAKSYLHKILKLSENVMDINGLAVAYCYQTEKAPTPDNIEHVRGQIRAYLLTDHAFEIGRGGMAKVYRITDDKGKPTNVEVVEPASSGAAGANKQVERYTAKVKALGITKAQFETAKAQGNTTMNQLTQWAAKHAGH